MPILKSAIKKLRQDRKVTLANKKLKKRMMEAVKKFRKNPTKQLLARASSMLDKAAKRRLIHKNKAARLNSQLAVLV
jgi:small subunit ribosomal protein S20